MRGSRSEVEDTSGGGGGIARPAWRTRAKRVLSGGLVLIAAVASLATTDIECPRVATLPDSVVLDPNTSVTRRYRVVSSGSGLQVVLNGTSAGDADVRVRLEPDDPSRFHPDPLENDAAPGSIAELALRPGTQAGATLALYCRSECDEYGFTVTVDHLAGVTATLQWDVIAGTASCNEDVHVLIERQ